MTRKEIIILCMAVLIAVAPPVVFYLAFHQKPVSSNPAEWGALGDFLSGTTGLFAGIVGLFVVLHTYIQQKAKDRQADFETKVFKLLDYQLRLVDSLQYGSASTKYVGISALRAYCTVATNTLNPPIVTELEKRPVSRSDLENVIQTKYALIYSKGGYSLGHYFRNLYYAFRFFSNAQVPDSEKQFFAKLLRAQLSTEELVLIGLNGLTEYGRNFKPLITEFQLLHGLMDANVFRAAFVATYPASAFGSEDIEKPLPTTLENERWYASIT